jgi:predicted deacetylase
MSARYLVRFDDICPTMNWSVWSQVEVLLCEHRITPILAVVPDNRDPKLVVADSDPRFWDRVREWQARGWTIGLHGYQHTYVTRDAGLLGLNARSEFSGLSAPEQEAKLRLAIEILRREGVAPEVWIAPAHSFDTNTLLALARLGVTCLSDGFSPFPYSDDRGMVWVPQQLWRFRPMPFGVWTVCFHPNSWTAGQLDVLRANLSRYRHAITDFRSVVDAYAQRRRTFADSSYAAVHSAALLLKRQWQRGA